MSVCVQCGIERDDGALLCPQHERESLDTWAEGNRIICDWIHRGKLPESPPDRTDDAAWIRPWTPEVLFSRSDEPSPVLAPPASPDFLALAPGPDDS